MITILWRVICELPNQFFHIIEITKAIACIHIWCSLYMHVKKVGFLVIKFCIFIYKIKLNNKFTILKMELNFHWKFYFRTKV
jgi:hypothetical protein